MTTREPISLQRRPFVVAGPCSAESATQVLECAHALAADGRIALMRAGVWKPRTRPGGFEGMGPIALEWLAAAQRETGLRVCIEVATPEHVAAARNAGITAFWLGARTTSDPFAVERVAECLEPTDGPIFVKNPISPDLELWIGAIERVRRRGHPNVIAVLRGFYPYARTRYRNTPHWDVALTLRGRFANLPILCDPSHIAGNKALVQEIAQKAYDYNLDGLFIEVHPRPSEALSDARQQLSPAEMTRMLAALTPPAPKGIRAPEAELAEMRTRIDTIDSQVLELLAQRKQIIEEIGRWKAAHNTPPFQADRWRELLLHHLRYGQRLGLSTLFVKNLCELVHTESLRLQGQQRTAQREAGEHE